MLSIRDWTRASASQLVYQMVGRGISMTLAVKKGCKTQTNLVEGCHFKTFSVSFSSFVHEVTEAQEGGTEGDLGLQEEDEGPSRPDQIKETRTSTGEG